MSAIGDFNNSMFGAIYGSGNGNSSGIDLANYASIRNGSYKKALTAYYKSENGQKALKESGYKTKTVSGKDSTNSLARMQTSASDLASSAAKLLQGGTKSVFAQKKNEETGKEEYDKDKIYKSVENFVDSYNTMINNVVKTNTTNIATAAAGMINLTKNNSGLLANVGITMEDDYTLKLDKDDFKDADMGDVKALFNSTGGYGYQVSSKASMINYYAQNEISKTSNYTGTGSYSYFSIVGSSYDSTT